MLFVNFNKLKIYTQSSSSPNLGTDENSHFNFEAYLQQQISKHPSNNMQLKKVKNIGGIRHTIRYC